MIIYDAKWEKIRNNFSESDKELLRQSVATKIICPAGVLIKDSALPPRLRKKLKDALEEVK